MNDELPRLFSYWAAGGPVLIPIAMVAFFVWLYLLSGRRRIAHATETVVSMVAELESGTVLNPNEIKRAPESDSEDLLVSIQRAAVGKQRAKALDMVASRIVRGLSRDVILLSAFTAAAPLLGLLGTVMGMIQTFDGVSGSTGETAASVSSGISRALITTQYGLVVAIPGVFGVARLRRMINRLRVAFGNCKAHVLAGVIESA